jgi:hypothetical protein
MPLHCQQWRLLGAGVYHIPLQTKQCHHRHADSLSSKKMNGGTYEFWTHDTINIPDFLAGGQSTHRPTGGGICTQITRDWIMNQPHALSHCRRCTGREAHRCPLQSPSSDVGIIDCDSEAMILQLIGGRRCAIEKGSNTGSRKRLRRQILKQQFYFQFIFLKDPSRHLRPLRGRS